MRYKKLLELLKEAERELLDNRMTRTGGTVIENMLLKAQAGLMSAILNIESASSMEESDD